MLSEWTDKHSDAAQAEGWDLRECESSIYGRWQLWASEDSMQRSASIDSDDSAWEVVLFGTREHHQLAQRLIHDHNPKEWLFWVNVVRKKRPDIDLAVPGLIAKMTAIKLTHGEQVP